MKFKQNTRRKAIEYEKDLVKYWKNNQTFQKSVNARPKDNAFVFYDGPPFITGVPHHGTLLTSIVKDAVPRYWTMKGKRVERTWGWDCHGLPAEVFTEKKLGIHDRRDIGTKISLEEYITTCRENMVQTGNLWESTIDRIGRWVDFKGAYKTMDKEFMESVWWAFKQLYEKGKIYEGERVLMYCTRDATPISKAEVAMDNSYQDVTDPSVYVKFRLFDDSDMDPEDELELEDISDKEYGKKLQRIKEKNSRTPKTYLLAWTTTPWTLLANTAVAINKDITYVKLEIDGEWLILAKDTIEKVMTDERHQPLQYKIIDEFKGSELRDRYYEPLFSDRGKGAHAVWHADYVTTDEGTGIVHLAPAYGEEDYEFAKAKHIPVVHTIDGNGLYIEGNWKGQNVWDANKDIAKTLKEDGTVWKIDYITHSYPHCHRCGTKLMYRAHPSWFMDIDGQRQEMLEQNGDINWFPEHIKHGRFAKTVQSAPDWNLSRDRFWATAMPVWKGTDKDGKEHIKVIGSYAELKELSGVELEDYHRPWVDGVTFKIDDVVYQRIDKVMDCWFESGSMPFAQFHYPFENTQKFEENFPGDFIVEYVPQVRAWFYYMHAVSIGLFGKSAFKNALVHGTIAGNDGRKMSKSFGNYTDPNELMDQYSADALRFLFLSSPLLNGEDFTLLDKDVNDVNRKLSMIWNMYDFFTLYADVDGWVWDGTLTDPTEDLDNPLDQWIVSRVHQLSETVDEHMQKYDIPNAMKPMLEFLDDASNWYVRRSRKRFWKSDNDSDKQAAYRTLHYVLVQVSMIFAPFTPFLSEELYRKLTGGESVHLLDWPEAGHVNELLIRNMKLLRHLITIGLSVRAENKLKVRQPLAKLTLQKGYKNYLTPEMLEILKEELNVKDVQFDDAKFNNDKSFWENLEAGNFSQLYQVDLDTKLTPALKQEGLMREVIRQVQNARKQADLQVDDRIELQLSTGDKALKAAIEEHQKAIMTETLATKLSKEELKHTSTSKIEGQELKISLQKSS
jgi:isoleucyl-tRNA synthetase